MKIGRITKHPILPVIDRDEITIYWQGLPLQARREEMIASALIANGVKVFSKHHKDGSPQGIFCANGQCSKCMVIANGIPVKACMTKVKANMMLESVDGLPQLPDVINDFELHDIEETTTDVVIIGGGPAGLSAAAELSRFNVEGIIVDDKHALGGKLVLQTHKFFGSVEDSYAGTRGIEIGRLLQESVRQSGKFDIWTDSTVLFIFKDRKIGVLKDGIYKLISPSVVLNTAGAREKFLRFPGNTLPGIFGAGAFQTIVNRDLVKPSENLFIIGGGNVGLIAGYHAIQAGINVIGLAEAMDRCGGYKVHADKLKRLGVPIYTSHSIISAQGSDAVNSITIAEVDKKFNPISGTEKTFKCDTVLIAVGLESISEFTLEAEAAGLPVFSAGDAFEIAEASSAMFNGKIAGLEVANYLGHGVGEIPYDWLDKAEILKAPPGKTVKQIFPDETTGVMPIIHCIQEIPCNPCSTICPTDSIKLRGDSVMGIPEYTGQCTGCYQCVAICPGLAITLVDFRSDSENPIVTMPYEISNMPVTVGEQIDTVDIDGKSIGKMTIVKILQRKLKRIQLVQIKAPKAVAKKIVAFRVQSETIVKNSRIDDSTVSNADDSMVCLCERVSSGEVRKLIRKGVRDINQIKAITRAGMGPCGSKNCDNMIRQIFRQEGIDTRDIVSNTRRPLFVEVPLAKFADGNKGGDSND